MTYILFGGEDYYPHGGFEDFLGVYPSHEEARQAAAAMAREWWHIVNVQTLCIVEKRERGTAYAFREGCQCPECKITPHLSSCAVHNLPAFPKGPCDCGAIKK